MEGPFGRTELETELECTCERVNRVTAQITELKKGISFSPGELISCFPRSIVHYDGDFALRLNNLRQAFAADGFI